MVIMSSEEKWIKWKPNIELTKQCYAKTLTDNLNGFEIILVESENSKKIKIKYENSVEAYRNTNESLRLKLFPILIEQQAGKWTFFKVINSPYLKWLFEESEEIIDFLNCTHFAFITYDSIIDVVANYEPKIEFINDF